jgi:dihydrodipicolinate synthase/N-acetylneuraminate lyase
MKDIQECRDRLHGIFNITVTPFTKTGEFDFAAMAENIERVIGMGYDGLLIGGTYGEFPVMTTAERAELFRRVMDIVGDRVPVMLCSAGSDARQVIELTQLAGDLGGLPMVTPPFVSEITDAQIVAFFKKVAPLSKTGILIYNAPGIGITIPVPVIQQIAEVDGIVGLKQGELNPTVIDQLANTLGGKIKLFCASDMVFPGPMMAGFDGISSTQSGAVPEVILATFRAIQRGDAKTAIDLHQSWYPLRAMARKHGQPQMTKAAMNLRGFKGGSVRAPLLDLEGAALEELQQVMAALAKDSRTGVTLA